MIVNTKATIQVTTIRNFNINSLKTHIITYIILAQIINFYHKKKDLPQRMRIVSLLRYTSLNEYGVIFFIA